MAVSRTLHEYSVHLNARADQFVRAAQILLQAVIIRAGHNLVERTPVDTGQARGNWIATIGAPASGYTILGGTDSEEEAYNQSIRPILIHILADDTVFITNSLHYIGDLNRGKSAQAPANFARYALLDGLHQGFADYKTLNKFR